MNRIAGMITGILYILIIAAVVGPALLGIKEMKELQDSGTGLSHEEKMRLGKLFGPMAFLIFVIIIYLSATFMILSRQG